MSDNRPIVYYEGDNVIYRASSVGSCVRALVAAGLEYEPVETPDYLSRAAAEGNLHEADIQNKVRAMGFQVDDSQPEIQIEITDGVFLRGHMDGIVTGPAAENLVGKLRNGSPQPDPNVNQMVLEAKTMSRSVFDSWKKRRFDSKPAYAYQVTAYMKATGLPALYAVKRRDDGLMEYTFLPETPVPWETVEAKILKAEEWRLKGELPPCDIENTWGCAYWYLHEEDDDITNPADDLSETSKRLLAQIAPKYRDLKNIEKEAKSEAAQLKPQIHTLMGGFDTVEVDGWRITWVVQERTGWNMDLLVADVAEGDFDKTLDRYRTTFTVEYPLIKKKGNNDGVSSI